jgi:hypothetical protein
VKREGGLRREMVEEDRYQKAEEKIKTDISPLVKLGSDARCQPFR